MSDPAASPAETREGRIEALSAMYEDAKRLDAACEVMHDAYEDAAHRFGWDSQVGAIPWAEVPEANKATMRVAVRALMAHLAASPAAVPQPDPKD